MSCFSAPRLLFCLAAAALPWSPVSQGETPSKPGPRSEARAARSENYCLGGIEDRKIIVHESQVTNPFRQTTLLGCQVDGGDPQVMPDLPAPSAVEEVMS